MLLKPIVQAAQRPSDIASAVFFRIAFGAVCAFWAWDYLSTGRVTRLYVAPEFHFKYSGFEYVEPLPSGGMYLLFILMLVLAICITCGAYYRLSSAAFAICFSYFFLLERTNYQNHYYLILLVSWLMPWLPLNRSLSVDERRGIALPRSTIPTWVYWILQFHIAIPYFYGGIAKIGPDWLQGQPMGMFLATKAQVPLLGSWLSWPLTAYLLSWGGLVFDLSIVPALLWPKTRWIAYLLSIGFHLTNSLLFQIHIFPWMMILASTIFFSPSWPRRLLGAPPLQTIPETDVVTSPTTKWIITVGCLWVLFHCIWPLRCHLHRDVTSWTERGHLFSWRMMLRAKEVGIGYAVVDTATGRAANVDHKQFIDAEQAEKFARDPELIRQMAHFIADKFARDVGRRPQVFAFVLASLNGRKPQLMIDPNVDLAAQPPVRGATPAWILPLLEPFRDPPWDVPIDQWKEHIELPEIEFLQRLK